MAIDFSGLAKSGLKQGVPLGLGGLFEDPTKGSFELGGGTSPALAGQLTNVRDQSLRDEGSLIDMQLKGTREAASPFLAQDTRSASALGGMDPALGDAIQKRAQKQYDRAYAGMDRQIRNEAPTYRFNRILQPMNSFGKQAQLDLQLADMQNQVEAEKYAARVNTVKSLFGGIGTAVGAIAGGYLGGPQGAATGAQVGSQMGGNKVNNPYSNSGKLG